MRSLLVTIISVFLLLSLTCMVSIAPAPREDNYVFGSNILINDDSGSASQRTPDIAVTDNGNIYIVWADERNSTLADIYSSSSTDSGKLFGDGTADSDVRVDNDMGGNTQRDPATTSNGNTIYAVWMDERSGKYHIYFAKSTDNGATFTGHTKIDNSVNEVVCEFPDIAVSSTGRISVVWHSTSVSNTGIYYSESTDGGINFIPSVKLNDSGKYAKIAVGSAGDKYVVWQNNDDIIFTSTSASSTTFQTQIQVDDGSAGTDQTRPTIAAYGSSNVYIAWHDERNGASGDIYFDKSTNKGSSFGLDVKADDENPGLPVQDKPSITVDSGGTIHLVWLDRRNSVNQIYYSNSTNGGTSFNTNMRVDDAQPGQTIDCSDPEIASAGPNKIYVVWRDKRNDNQDIYFSRWGLSSQMGYLPTMTDDKINKQIGGINEGHNEFRWEVVYKDLDGEAPAAGFPRVHIYTDHSKTTELSGSPFVMNWKKEDAKDPLKDRIFSNGELYTFTKKLTELHDYAFLFGAKAVSGAQTLVETDLKFGPILDVDPPIFFDPEPSSNKWFNKASVECSITISDPEGTGVDSSKIQYQYKTNSSDEFTRFYTNANVLPITQGYRCKTTITFTEGAENYIRWNATDTVNSGPLGYNLSDMYEIKIDTNPVTFSDPSPLEENWQNSKSIICGITINDHGGSGVDGSTIQYHYRSTGEVNFLGPFSAAVAKNGETITATTPSAVDFGDGVDNYIKWSAKDIANNTATSVEFQVKIDTDRPPNTPPTVPKNIKPTITKDSTPVITWNASFDSDGHELEYFIRIGTYEDGDDILKWTGTGTDTSYLVKDSDSLAVDTYYVQVRAYDDLDYSPIARSIMNITATGNNPPSPPTAIYPNVTAEPRPTITWSGASDLDNDTLTYRIQIGTGSGSHDILRWKNVEMQKDHFQIPITIYLDDGIYYVQVMSLDENGDSSSAYEEILKVASFQPELEVKNEFSVKQGDIFVIIDMKLTNNCTMTDNMTMKITGDLTTKTSVEFTFKPTMPILVQPGDTKSIKLTITLPPQINLGDYSFDLQAFSEDGETSSFTRSVVLHVVIKPSNGVEPNGDTDDDDKGGVSMDAYLPLIIFVIVLIVIILIIVGVVRNSMKHKRDKKEHKLFDRKEEEYEDLYGPKDKY